MTNLRNSDQVNLRCPRPAESRRERPSEQKQTRQMSERAPSSRETSDVDAKEKMLEEMTLAG